MSAILPPRQPSRRPAGSPLPAKLEIPPKDGSSTPALRTKPSLVLPPPLPRGCEPAAPPAQGPPSSSSSASRRPALSIASVGSSAASGASLGAVSSSGSITSLYPTTITSFDPDQEDGGRIADPERIIGDIQKAMSGLGVNEGGARKPRSRSGSGNSVRPRIKRPGVSEGSSMGSGADAIGRVTTISTCDGTLAPPQVDDDGGEMEGLEIAKEDLEILKSLGEGAGGEVKKVLHKPTGLLMAKKTIPTSPNPSVHRQILRELAFNRTVSDGQCPNLVKYYGAFLEENDTQIAILMELCEGGSLDAIYKRIKARSGRTGEKILGRVATSVLQGLTYLHGHKIIHRDIKPSNIVVTREGQIKLCDLGVSGELIGSLAGTFMGTSAYMAPERIRGEKYSIRSDVWSLGLTLLELALNRFPLSADGAQLHPFELLQTVITFQVPSLTGEEDKGVKWTKGLRNFIGVCLEKDPSKRPSPEDLLLQHPWVLKSQTWTVDIAAWVRDVWDWPDPGTTA